MGGRLGLLIERIANLRVHLVVVVLERLDVHVEVGYERLAAHLIIHRDSRGCMLVLSGAQLGLHLLGPIHHGGRCLLPHGPVMTARHPVASPLTSLVLVPEVML